MPPLGLLLLPVPAMQSLRLEYVLGLLGVVVVACRAYGTHRVLKWPIFLSLCLLMIVDLVAYTVVRVLIHLLTRHAEPAVEDAQTYKDWRLAAERADREEGRDSWRYEDASEEYDWRHVKATTERLRRAREAGDEELLMSLLLRSLKNNAFGELELDLYTRTRLGTKLLLEQYRDEVCRSLRALKQAKPPAGSAAELARREFALAARASLGGCALVLSGGATFGMFHFGVVKALIDLHMLPDVICGASAGAVVAATVCTRNDEELARICSDQSELYREMGWAGPLHGSNWWKLIQLLRNVRETCAHSNTSQHTLILALAPTISSHRVRSTPLRTFIGIWRGLPSGSRSAKPLRRRAAY